MWKRKLVRAAALAALALGAVRVRAQAPWSYEGATGPDHWGDLSPQYAACKSGAGQSPIDIRNAQHADLPPIQFDYKRVPLTLINTGHNVQVDYPPGSSITVKGQPYQLAQFHFHYPSEERIDGKQWDMVLHLVHTSANGQVAVVSVLFAAGAANLGLDKIWAAIPKTPGKEQEVVGVEINARDFLPKNKMYYTYQGSLTTPPCTEGVTWMILKTPVTASAQQLKALAAIFPPDARPLQPLAGRVVKVMR